MRSTNYDILIIIIFLSLLLLPLSGSNIVFSFLISNVLCLFSSCIMVMVQNFEVMSNKFYIVRICTQVINSSHNNNMNNHKNTLWCSALSALRSAMCDKINLSQVLAVASWMPPEVLRKGMNPGKPNWVTVNPLGHTDSPKCKHEPSFIGKYFSSP